MRILHVASGFPPSAVAGVEQYTHMLTHQQVGRHNVAVFCREYAPDLPEYAVQDETLNGLNVRRVVNNFRRVSNLRSHYRNLDIEKLFQRYLAEIRPDIVHFQHCFGLSAGLPSVVRAKGIPCVLTLHDYWYICPTTRLLTRDLTLCDGPHHGADCRQCLGVTVQVSTFLHRIPLYPQIRDAVIPHGLQRKLLAQLEGVRPTETHATDGIPKAFVERVDFMRGVLNSASRLLVPSSFCRHVYVDFGVRDGLIQVLPEGLELERWQHIPPRTASPALRFGYIGGLSAHKGVDVLLQAFRELPQRDIQLRVFGAGAPGEPFEKRLRDGAAGDARIHFHGRYRNQDLPGLLAEIDVIVIPSRWHETFSIVTREALLAGAAVIAADVGAIPEVIVNNENGLLVPPADKDALKQALTRLADDRSLVERLSEGAHATPVTGIEAHALKLESIYREVLGKT
jgi:glycosyltransferase involved in cell wall biosynthesis